MKRMNANSVGIDSGETVLFSDFQDGGEMWTGKGQRERRNHITFSTPYRDIPTVHASLALWDVDNATVMRADLRSENVTKEGFTGVPHLGRYAYRARQGVLDGHRAVAAARRLGALSSAPSRCFRGV